VPTPPASRTPRRRQVLSLTPAVALTLLLATAVAARAQEAPPDAPTAGPTTPALDLPPTAAPTTPAFDLPPIAAPPDSESDDEEAEAPPPPPPATEVPGQPTPTRTRRPTRTPRTTPTVTPSPVPLGGLRLVLTLDPPVPAVGESMAVSLVLANPASSPVENVTLQLTVPAGLILGSVTPTSGQVARTGEVVRWYVPRLETGQLERLRIVGAMARAVDEGAALCVLALAPAAPLEECVEVRTLASPAGAAATAPVLPETSGQPPAPRLALDATTLGWGMLILGLGFLGLALGLRRRPARG